jgi:phi13 family phage major tail protein
MSNQNKITFGLNNVYYSKITIDNSGGETYGTPNKLLGAQEISHEFIGGSQSVFADDCIIATLTQNAGRSITLKLTELPESFKTDILGFIKLPNGNILEVNNTPTVYFALGFEIQGDVKARRVWFYKCSVTPVNESSKTKSDSVETNSITLNITAQPIRYTDKLLTHIVASSGDTNYLTFFDNVKTPQTVFPAEKP